MAESVVAFVLQRLHDIISTESEFLYGVRDQVQQIQTELNYIKCFLRDADERQHENKMIRQWVADVREVSYDAEDTIEIYVSTLSLRADTNFLSRSINILQRGTTLHKIGSRIEGIKSRISQLKGSLTSYGLVVTHRSPQSRLRDRPELRRSFSHVVDKDFVGLEEDMQQLVKHLVDEDRHGYFDVVSICGMGGIGKTTLARRVYHHGEVRRHFDSFAWASITHQWHPLDVLQSILPKLVPEKRDTINNRRYEELVKELYEVLQRKECLIVLDDVWSAEFWDILKPVFPFGKMRSKILLTTRNRKVCRYEHLKFFVHIPRFLNEDESWELLKKKAFPGESAESKITSPLARIGRAMIRQCGGLPLAIVVLGGLLRTRSTEDEWENVQQCLDSNSMRGRISEEDYERVFDVLSLSYHDLEYHLKPCFLYLGTFPQGCEVPAQKLYQLWFAEGFIPVEYQEDQEEVSIGNVAERYLVELRRRCMVEVQVEESTGRIKTCRLHDIMRDMCLYQGKEENFLRIIPARYNLEPREFSPSFNPTPTRGTRRLSVMVDLDFESYFHRELENNEGIRSALFFSRLPRRSCLLRPAIDLLAKHCKLLRVLDLERFCFQDKLPKSIGNLVHLRYLSLKGSEFKKLPSSIRNLKCLQTLNLQVYYFSYLTLPDGISKLKNLRYLYLPPSHGKNYKLSLGSLNKLEMLKNFDTQVSDFRDLSKFTKLRKISAILSLDLDELEEIVNYLTSNSHCLRESSFRVFHRFYSEKEVRILRQLLGCYHLHKLDLIGYVGKLPEPHEFSRTLTKLTLRNSELKEDPMATLEKLPRMKTLSLRGNAFTGRQMSCTAEGFPELKSLELHGLPSLETWIVEKGAMPNLLHLIIDGCLKLEMVPDGLSFVKVQEFVVADMPEAFKSRLTVMEGVKGADFHKVFHISSITIIDTKDYPKNTSEKLTAQDVLSLLRPVYPSLLPRNLGRP